MIISNNLFYLSGSCFSAVNNKSILGEVYGINTDQGLILIDCGEASTGPVMLRKTLKKFNINSPITHIILTHGHHDHCGGAKELQEAGAKVIVGAGDAIYCKQGGPNGTPYDIEQSFPAFIPDIEISADREMIINGIMFEFIMIPGHTNGGMAIRVKVDDKFVLFTGDTLEADGTFLNKFLFGWEGDPAFNKEEIVNSIMKLTKYKADIVLSGHGKICLINGTKLIRQAAKEVRNILNV